MKKCPNCNRKCSPLAVQCPNCQTLLFDVETVSNEIDGDFSNTSPLFQSDNGFIMQHPPLFEDFPPLYEDTVFTGSNLTDSDYDGYLTNDITDLPEPDYQLDDYTFNPITPTVNYEENAYYLTETPIDKTILASNGLLTEPSVPSDFSQQQNINTNTTQFVSNNQIAPDSQHNAAVSPTIEPKPVEPSVNPQNPFWNAPLISQQKTQSDGNAQISSNSDIPLQRDPNLYKYIDNEIDTTPQPAKPPFTNQTPTSHSSSQSSASFHKEFSPLNNRPAKSNSTERSADDNANAKTVPFHLPNRPPISQSDEDNDFISNVEENIDEVPEFVYNKELIQQFEYDKNYEFTENDIMTEEEERQKQQEFYNQYLKLNPHIKKYKKRRGLSLWMIILLIIGSILVICSLPLLLYFLSK